MIDRVLYTFPAAKGFVSGKIQIYEMCVERLAEEWIAASSPMFATEWPSFHKFSRGPILMKFLTNSPASGWTLNFSLDYMELPSVSLNNYNHNIIMLLIMLM